jgi:outer membrane protein
MTRRIVLLATLLLPTTLLAQAVKPAWGFRTRVQASGSAVGSEPVGYRVYSGITLGAALSRDLGRHFGVELAAATESREVNQAQIDGADLRLGSIELLPVNLLLQVRPGVGGRAHPYAGAGINLTVAWEKSGALDSQDVAPSIGPALQVGTDIDLAPSVLLNLDVRWNVLRTDIGPAGSGIATLKIDPMTFGVGLGFRF